MRIKYLQLKPDSLLPNISELSPFRSVIVIEETVTPIWQSIVSSWLVRSGCLYMMAWGNECSSWDDSVDYANLKEFNYEAIPEDKFVITTWHENEPLTEVFWFSKNTACHPTVDLKNTLVGHISKNNKEKELLLKYAEA